jgi:hypothetical protein
MRPNRIPIAQIVAGCGVAVAVGAAPVAAAENHQSCGGVGGSIQCQTPGDVRSWTPRSCRFRQTFRETMVAILSTIAAMGDGQ